MAPRWLGLLALLAALAACKTPAKKRRTPVATAAPTVLVSVSVPPVSASATAGAAASASAAGPPASAAEPTRTAPPGDACRVTRGPIQLSFTGPAAFVAGGDAEPRIVFNGDGVPRAVVLPLGAVGTKVDAPLKSSKPVEARRPERLALTEPPERSVSPACAAAGASLFCLDKAGGIHRSSLTGEGSVIVAQARVGSPMAAATIAGTRVVYAFLADRKTSEGATTLAFAALDDGPPVVLSEDGSGATHVTLASRGEEALAMYIDARRALTPVHARVLKGGPLLGLGPDAVVFVGGGGDARPVGALAQGNHGHELVLLPIDKDEHGFGMAAIRIEEQPRDDSATTWSLYPSALERPAIAATQGGLPIRVLRTLPAADDAGTKRVLELGELDATGAWKPLCPVAQGASFTDLAIAADATGALWIAYTDADGTWVEKRGR
jgi:hypothetical protein